MCMEDIRIGRQIRSNIVSQSVPTTQTILVGASPSRVFLILFPSPTRDYVVSNVDISGTTQGIVVKASGMPVYLHIKDYGDSVTKKFVVKSIGGTDQITYMEGLLELT